LNPVVRLIQKTRALLDIHEDPHAGTAIMYGPVTSHTQLPMWRGKRHCFIKPSIGHTHVLVLLKYLRKVSAGKWVGRTEARSDCALRSTVKTQLAALGCDRMESGGKCFPRGEMGEWSEGSAYST